MFWWSYYQAADDGISFYFEANISPENVRILHTSNCSFIGCVDLSSKTIAKETTKQ